MDYQNPYAAPQAEEPPVDFAIEGDPSIVRSGEKLLVPEGAELPMRCVSCNRPAEQELKVWAIRGLRRLLLRMLFIAAVSSGSTYLMLMVHQPLMPAVMPATIAVVLAVFHLRRHHDMALFQFCICAKHRAIRYASLALTWVAVGAVLIGAWAPRLLPIDPRIDFLPVFAMCATASVILAYATHVQIRASQGPIDPYVFHGFGKRYLESFPTAVDLHLRGAHKRPSEGKEPEGATTE